MLITQVERYVSLRRTLGYKLRNTSGNLRAFAKFAAARRSQSFYPLCRVPHALRPGTSAPNPCHPGQTP